MYILRQNLHQTYFDDSGNDPSPKCKMVALYQITVVYGGRHLVRVFPGAPGYVVLSIWLHLISLVTVD